MSAVLCLAILAGCARGTLADIQTQNSSLSNERHEQNQPMATEKVDAIANPIAIEPKKTFNDSCHEKEKNDAYRLGAEDRLDILVYGETELSGNYTLDTTGHISMPLIGDVLLGGCNIRQAQEIIKNLYADGYLVDPSISVEVSNFRPFYILGEVKSPGKYDYVAGMNVLKAAAIAGGFTYRANRKVAKVLRYDSYGEPVYHQQILEDEVQPGDVITIPEKLF
ncbi:MAG: polysaccharide export protein [Rhodospirillales bacterium]|nr:MAG: polysaccharide export protein [Rhodospirillales bacterium]